MLARLVLALLTSSVALHQHGLRAKTRDHQILNNTSGIDPPVVHIAYATTPDGFPGLLHSMISVARNFQGKLCHIHVIVAEDHITKASEVLACFERDVANLTSVTTASLDVMPALPWDTSLMRTSAEGLARSWGHQDKLSQPTVFARFYLHQILHDLPRVLWLDVDTIVCTDVTDLFLTQMTTPIAARPIKKQVVGHEFKGWSCTKDLDQKHQFTSFNTGVMVLDLNRWREGNFTHQLERTAAACVTNDQPTFNIVFMDKIQHFEKSWNTFALGSTVKARTKRVGNILHWSGPVKPWSEPEKCESPEVRKNDTDCLSAENHADYDAYAPRETCPAI
jgi:lipopolysaccharide biosynthesis glycosyltransferase